jgi:arginase
MGVAHLLDLPGTHSALAGLGPRRPLLGADRLCFVGFADDEEDVHGLVPSARIPATAVLTDPTGAARQALDAVAAAPDGFLVHVDVDVLDMFTLPLADIPQYGSGLTPGVLRDLLAGLVSDPGWWGIVVAEANPDRDDERGTAMHALVDLLGSALGG